MRRNRGEGVELGDIFPRVQEQMVAAWGLGGVSDHPTIGGLAAEQQWIEFFRQHLPRRYTAASAFVMSSNGKTSRQIDIAIYDSFYSPTLLAREPGLHIPAESVYAVFEVKQEINAELLRDAGVKAASVRDLRRTSAQVISMSGPCRRKEPHGILAGILAVRSPWKKRFGKHVARVLQGLPTDERLDLGCALQDGAFELRRRGKEEVVKTSPAREALSFFFVRLVERLRVLGTVPAVDLMEYGRSLESLQD